MTLSLVLKENKMINCWENRFHMMILIRNLSGAGQGCHPFTGWSALTVLMMKES